MPLLMSLEEFKFKYGLVNYVKYGIKKNVSFPKVIEIQTINRCNAKCPMCPYMETTAKEKLHIMDDKRYSNLLNQLKHQDEFEMLVIAFQSEPLVDPNIIKRAKQYKKMMPNKRLEIVTNGSLLVERGIEDVYKYFDMVQISLNAHTRETYLKVMGNLDIKAVLDAIKIIEKNDVWRKKTVIRFINQDANIEEKKKFKKFWNKRGFVTFGFDINSRLGSVKNFDDQKVKRNKASNVHFNLKKMVGKLILPTCPIPFTSCFIRANGDLLLCFNDWSNNYVLGNIFERSIKEIFNSPQYKKIRDRALEERILDNPVCRKCDLFNDGVWVTA